MKVGKKAREEVIEGEEVRTYWDFKKIIIGGVIIVTLLILASYMFVPKYAGEKDTKSTLGTSTEELPPLPDQEDVENILENAQDTLSTITSKNLTSSQAAIQKVIADLQKLQDNSPGGVICDLVCGGSR